MIAGFEIPSKGDILLKNKDITNLPPNKRPINMVFQRYALFPHLDVYDNVDVEFNPDNEERMYLTYYKNSYKKIR